MIYFIETLMVRLKQIRLYIDKFYACGTYSASTVNTYQTQSFVMKLDGKLKVEKFKFVKTTAGGSVDGRDLYCDMYGDDILGAMITDAEQIVFMKMDTQISTIEAYGHDLAHLSNPRVNFSAIKFSSKFILNYCEWL